MTGLQGPPVNNALLPWRVDVDVVMDAAANTNWATNAVGTASLKNGTRNSSAAQNAEVSWNVLLAAGTWTITLMHRTASSRGVYSVQIDDVEVGTIDGYSAVTTENVLTSVTGIVVATPGIKKLSLKMLTKNASSSGYLGSLVGVTLRRTA